MRSSRACLAPSACTCGKTIAPDSPTVVTRRFGQRRQELVHLAPLWAADDPSLPRESPGGSLLLRVECCRHRFSEKVEAICCHRTVRSLQRWDAELAMVLVDHLLRDLNGAHVGELAILEV